MTEAHVSEQAHRVGQIWRSPRGTRYEILSIEDGGRRGRVRNLRHGTEDGAHLLLMADWNGWSRE